MISHEEFAAQYRTRAQRDTVRTTLNKWFDFVWDTTCALEVDSGQAYVNTTNLHEKLLVNSEYAKLSLSRRMNIIYTCLKYAAATSEEFIRTGKGYMFKPEESNNV